MRKIVEFYDRLYLEREKCEKSIAEELHAFAEKNLSMGVAFKPVIDYLKDEAGR